MTLSSRDHANFKQPRFLKNLQMINNEEEEEDINFQDIAINSPSDDCKKLILSLFEETRRLNFQQFCLFHPLANLNLLKRALENYDDQIIIEDENNFVDFFMNSFPFQESLLNDSMFSIFNSLVCKHFQHISTFDAITAKCLNHLKEDYFAELLQNVIRRHPSQIHWNYINLLPQKFFFNSVFSLLNSKIFPENRAAFIEGLFNEIRPGIFRIIPLLNLTQEELIKFDIPRLLFHFLESSDFSFFNDAFQFIQQSIKNNENNFLAIETMQNLFENLENYDFTKKCQIIKMLNSLIDSLNDKSLGSLIQKGILDVIGDLLFTNSKEIVLVSLFIIESCFRRLPNESLRYVNNFADVIENLSIESNDVSLQNMSHNIMKMLHVRIDC
ncbi:hypothetical protein TRFO_23476 [Tritrichomonas foetus]|uniref:Uncharacterized protein n=1 Tax=Tritrichomonas foetus TaxID=1144522 RepID=A0A1J4KAX8_9EUKA|nr:hypothetical protein TRFO_23476 [Tritrichomonas foetus]|eukprot:OHT08114.1 hypothetical protein TRFO_23476 [Tritrichomonas foetus]